jgi:hypothetical protein
LDLPVPLDGHAREDIDGETDDPGADGVSCRDPNEDTCLGQEKGEQLQVEGEDCKLGEVKGGIEEEVA